MNLQPDDFWTFEEWLLRPGKFLESALLQGIVLIVLSIVLGLLVGYIFSAGRHGPSEGFYGMARAIRDLLFRDLPGTSPRRIVALAGLAFKEAIRRKVLFVIGLFIVILLFAGWYLNGDSDDPARLYISFVLTATNYLILALALFISAFSLPQDIESRTIYTIVTKPVRATEIVLGRILGFIAVGTVMLLPMGLASYVFVKRGLDHSHIEIAEAEEVRGGGIEGETDFVRRHVHTFDIDEGETQGLSNFVRGHQHVVTHNGDKNFAVGSPVGHLRARIPVYGEIQFYDRDGNPKDAGIDVGQERLAGGYGSAGLARMIGVTKGTRKIEHGYVEGGTLGMAEFTFSDVTREKYPNGISLDMTIRAYRSYKGDIETGIRGSITVRNPDTRAESNPIAFIVDEYVVVERTLDDVMEGTDGEGNLRPGPKNDAPLDLFDDLVSADGRVQIIIKCLDRSQYLGVTKSSVYLRPDEIHLRVEFDQSLRIDLASNDHDRCLWRHVQHVPERSRRDGRYRGMRAAGILGRDDLRHAILHRLQYRTRGRTDRIARPLGKAGCDDHPIRCRRHCRNLDQNGRCGHRLHHGCGRNLATELAQNGGDRRVRGQRFRHF